MDSPRKAIAEYEELIGKAADHIEKQEWDDAKTALDKAITLDPVQVQAYDMLVTVYDGMHDPDQADHFRTRAKAIRQENWQRQVEADIRGQHEVLGASRREIT